MTEILQSWDSATITFIRLPEYNFSLTIMQCLYMIIKSFFIVLANFPICSNALLMLRTVNATTTTKSFELYTHTKKMLSNHYLKSKHAFKTKYTPNKHT